MIIMNYWHQTRARVISVAKQSNCRYTYHKSCIYLVSYIILNPPQKVNQHGFHRCKQSSFATESKTSGGLNSPFGESDAYEILI